MSTGEVAELLLVPVTVNLNCCMWLGQSLYYERPHEKQYEEHKHKLSDGMSTLM